MATVLNVLTWIVFIVITVLIAVVYFTQKVWLAQFVLWIAESEIFYDLIPEGYATLYQIAGAFHALGISYKGFGVAKGPGDYDYGIRRIGETDTFPEHIDAEGNHHDTAVKTYNSGDFHWDRRDWLVKKAFGPTSGVVYMGIWPAARPIYYNLRLSNFRTVKPNPDEILKKKAELREYKVSGQTAGWIISWNERTKHVLLSDDIYVFPIDGVRIGTRIGGKAANSKEKQAVMANILLFVRARVVEPYLYVKRVEDALEVIQNEFIQHVREMVACMSIEDIFEMQAMLKQEEVTNAILEKNGFGSYMRERYGFRLKSASFGYIDIIGDAGMALAAPFIAARNAEATATRGKGDGEAEYNRLIKEGQAFEELIKKLGSELAVTLRSADVAERFAAGGKSSTVILGFNHLADLVRGISGERTDEKKEGDPNGK